MKKIKLTKGKYAIVDDEDYHYLNRFKWTYSENKSGTICVLRSWTTGNTKRHLTMQDSIFVREAGCHNPIIWINRNRLDFRKFNLTSTGISEVNHYARRKNKNCISKYRGVSQYKNGKWRGQIEKGRRKTSEYICIAKIFKTEKKAGIWYNKIAKELYGKYAYQNKIINLK